MSERQHEHNMIPGGVTFHHAGAFWFGVIAVTAGTLLHLPLYLMGGGTGYPFAGLPMGGGMQMGVLAIILGLGGSLLRLYPSVGPQTAAGFRPSLQAPGDP